MKISATRLLDENDEINIADWGIEAREKLVELVDEMVNGAINILAKEPADVYFNVGDDPTELEIRLPFGPQQGDSLSWVVSLREAIEILVECSGREDALRLRKVLAALLDKVDSALAADERWTNAVRAARLGDS